MNVQSDKTEGTLQSRPLIGLLSGHKYIHLLPELMSLDNAIASVKIVVYMLFSFISFDYLLPMIPTLRLSITEKLSLLFHKVVI